MTKRETTIQFQSGLESRPIAMLVQVASRFDSSIYIETENKRVNAKSIMGMMGIAMAPGMAVTVLADGADEEDACEAVEQYINGQAV